VSELNVSEPKRPGSIRPGHTVSASRRSRARTLWGFCGSWHARLRNPEHSSC